MQRTKQQALMFVLGALLVGGAVGFTADRYIGHEKFAANYGPRAKFYDELGLSPTQRNALDSLAFQRDCAIRALLTPQKNSLDSLKARFQAERDSVLTKDQLQKFEALDKEMRARRDAEQAKEPKRTCVAN